MDKQNVINETSAFVKQILQSDASGHDWWHVDRVTKMAIRLAEIEGADVFTCHMAALLHDIADEKLNESEQAGITKVKNWVEQQRVEDHLASRIIEIIDTMSFKGGNRPKMTTIEGEIVQDADRLDAIGAIGIARTFAYAGARGELMYDPAILPRESMTKEQYRNEQSTAINHFYEKLFKLTNLMNTETAKQEAKQRHQFMDTYLTQFFKEWEV